MLTDGDRSGEDEETYFGNVDLNRGVVLSSDESVGSRAFSGNIEINNLLLVVLHICLVEAFILNNNYISYF